MKCQKISAVKLKAFRHTGWPKPVIELLRASVGIIISHVSGYHDIFSLLIIDGRQQFSARIDSTRNFH